MVEWAYLALTPPLRGKMATEAFGQSVGRRQSTIDGCDAISMSWMGDGC
jgi:hypothetical protein